MRAGLAFVGPGGTGCRAKTRQRGETGGGDGEESSGPAGAAPGAGAWARMVADKSGVRERGMEKGRVVWMGCWEGWRPALEHERRAMLSLDGIERQSLAVEEMRGWGCVAA